MAKLSPLNNKILVVPEIVEDSVKVGDKKIYLSDNTKHQMQNRINKGVVEEVGPEVKQVKVGDTIVTFPFAKSEVEIDQKIYHLISEEDVLAVWR